MERSKASTTSRPSDCPPSPEIARCEREIAAVEEALCSGHEDVAGLCLALSDWSAELRILQNEQRRQDGPGGVRGEGDDDRSKR